MKSDAAIGKMLSRRVGLSQDLTLEGLKDLRQTYASRYTVEGVFFWQNRKNPQLFMVMELNDSGDSLEADYVCHQLQQKGVEIVHKDECADWDGFPETFSMRRALCADFHDLPNIARMMIEAGRAYESSPEVRKGFHALRFPA